MCNMPRSTAGLPVSTKVTSMPALAGSISKPPEAPQSLGKVLVVEDNLINQRVAVIILSKLGYAAEVAGDGSEALEKLQKQHYDLILMDCQMPVMDGFEATHAIRALSSEVSKIPIIAVTANALAGQREKCLATGMNEYISKPINSELLASALRKYLDPSGNGKPPANGGG
jgi:CheY-like chemotaxis protein